jgi:hypothetical protein
MLKMPNDRDGRIHEIHLGDVEILFTVNVDTDGRVREIFGKCAEGHQGHVDLACTLISGWLRENHKAVEWIIDKLEYRRYPPEGGIGQPKSIADAISRVLKEYVETEA